MNISKEQAFTIARLVEAVLQQEGAHWDEVCDEYGEDSTQAQNHMYALALEVWDELGTDEILQERTWQK